MQCPLPFAEPRTYIDSSTVDGTSGSVPLSFQHIDKLALQDCGAAAIELLVPLLGLANNAGLSSDEYGPALERVLGDSAQAPTRFVVTCVLPDCHCRLISLTPCTSRWHSSAAFDDQITNY